MKKLIILTALLIGAKLNASAQTKMTVDSNMVFTLVEKMPSYIGGDTKFSEFLSSAINFSKIVKTEKCYYILTISKTGEVIGVKKLRGDISNEEQLTAAFKKSSGQWQPGSQNGNKVNVDQIVIIEIS